jgi:cytosine/adenosine deaminase-related metal-dependent hydrolase
MLLRARHVLPISAPSLEDGAVLVSGGRIEAVGRWSDLRPGMAGPVVDLGDVVLMPGLINTHCHLDYTHFAGHLAPPRSFTDWIQGVLALKAGWSFSEYAASWIAGAHQLVRCGCTTVLDIEAVPELLPEAWDSTPLRVISAFEVTGIRSVRSPAELLDDVLSRADTLDPAGNRFALSPHAPYSTRPELMQLAAAEARRRGLLLTTHVAESAEEFAMFRHGEGALHHWIGPQRGTADCGLRSPVAGLAELGVLGPGTLAVHANYLDDGDVARLAASGTTVVHCPRSHDYFGHAPFPLEALRAAGVLVCLGTDSMISVRRKGRARLVLDLFEELREFSGRHPSESPQSVLSRVTTLAARAIGRAGELGEIRTGAEADLVAVPCRGPVADPWETVLAHAGPVSASMVGGVWALSPSGLPGVGVEVA